MISDKFRHQLRHEAKLWQAEGLIDENLYGQISQRYQFDSLETSAQNRFIAIFIGLGGVLVGLAVITFVAANWQEWSREFRVILLLSLFIGVNATGFYLWRISPKSPEFLLGKNGGNTRGIVSIKGGWKQRLGHGLLLLGAIILGANIGLMSQMFHISGSPYGLYLVWGLGVLAMAYSLRLTSLGVLSILLIGFGYVLGVGDWRSKEEFNALKVLIDYMPLFAGLAFVPLAYWCRSRAIFLLAAIGVVNSLIINVLASSSSNIPEWIFIVSVCALPPALLWGYDDVMWPNIHSRLFQPLARNLSLFFLAILFYFGSFKWWNYTTDGINNSESILGWTPFISVILLAVLTVYEWLHLSRRQRKHGRRQGGDLTTNVMGVFIAISTLLPVWHFNVFPIGILAIFLYNVLLFLLGAGLIREGLAIGNRRCFWGGLGVLSLQILSRMLEYDTGLLFKAFVFFLCGVGVIVAGLWFERYSHRLMSSEEKVKI